MSYDAGWKVALMERVAQGDARNLLLSRLSRSDFDTIQPFLKRVPIAIGDTLARRGDRIETVYFPEGSVIAFLAGAGCNLMAAVGLVGFEGMIGVTALQGERHWTNDIVVRAQEGTALRIDLGRLLAACEESATLRDALLRFAGNFFMQVSRTSVTNMVASLEQRLARWILLYHDRVAGDAFELTHKELGLMLGIRRASATDVLHVLEGRGMISNRRSCVDIRDRAQLEAFVGEGYGDTEQDYRRRIAPFGKGAVAGD